MASLPGPAKVAEHNYGQKCRLAPILRDEEDAVPPVQAQYFYTSTIPIDDPLSSITTSSDARTARGFLRPFSRADNNALEKAWLSLASDEYRRNHAQARRNRSPSPSLAAANATKLRQIVHELASQHLEKHTREGPGREVTQPDNDALSDTGMLLPLCCAELIPDITLRLETSFCAVTRNRQRILDKHKVAQQVMMAMHSLHKSSTATGVDQPKGSPVNRKDTNCPAEKHPIPDSPRWSRTERTAQFEDWRPRARSRSQVTAFSEGGLGDYGQATGRRNTGISGMPFVRVETQERMAFPPTGSLPRPGAYRRDSGRTAETTASQAVKRRQPEALDTPRATPALNGKSQSGGSLNVPVGVSRLHEVTLPSLQMKPIYWSPVNDIAPVVRATWFYKDTMIPLDAEVANQLEVGYRELSPYSETWRIELKCAVEFPEGEEKVTHQLWPNDPDQRRRKNGPVEPVISSNPFCAARCFRGEAAAEAVTASSQEEPSSQEPSSRKYDQHQVIYRDDKTAFLLKPSLKPSLYYNRRPVARVMRGITVGIPVVRGFDLEKWTKIHEKKKSQATIYSLPALAAASASDESTGTGLCQACTAEKQLGQVTDLVLVAHGIGQKLAERVESYHFTHAINAFRRAVNIELANKDVKGFIREGSNIMVLPVNWRQNLSFEEGGPMTQDDKNEYTPDGFGLKDIEPTTIPAVRGMISDIMFDIPFYMSHHKPKMISALVGEANRVYRLWCKNNPSFFLQGRVHIIAHSLGSAMTLDILSHQPTKVPRLDPGKPLQLKSFEFDTVNLFLLGSPAAFFLLLERGALVPRRGRLKPGASLADFEREGVVGEVGSFGCIAVDNIYNILAKEDAVAYLLGGTVDPKYAAGLKTAYVPSTTATWLQSMGSAIKSIVPGASDTASHPALQVSKPPTLRLPSQMELEVHDFTREEIAEKKAFLLNDNGQIDYYLQSGGGPLEIQYLNMLSAHSSYWSNMDLIRMLCMEIGREPGVSNTFPAMRAVKKTKRTIPSMS